MKDDTISRAAALDALANYIHNVDRVYSTGKLTHEDCMDAAHSILDGLPSAQPPDTDTNVATTDTISRAAVLDEIHKYMEERDYTIGTLYDNICEMPSAQRWVPCEERLPEPGVNVLVDVLDIPADDRFPLVDKIGDDGDWCNCYGEWFAVAWVPIPDPWEGENDG